MKGVSGGGEWIERERESVLRIRFYASTEKFRGVPREYVTLSFGHVQRERKESTVLDEWPLIFRK